MRFVYWALVCLVVALALGTMFSFALGVAFNNEMWLGRARRLGRWSWLAILFGFNFWVWGTVAWTLIRWNRG